MLNEFPIRLHQRQQGGLQHVSPTRMGFLITPLLVLCVFNPNFDKLLAGAVDFVIKHLDLPLLGCRVTICTNFSPSEVMGPPYLSDTALWALFFLALWVLVRSPPELSLPIGTGDSRAYSSKQKTALPFVTVNGLIQRHRRPPQKWGEAWLQLCWRCWGAVMVLGLLNWYTVGPWIATKRCL